MDNLDDPREEADGYELPGLSLPTKFALSAREKARDCCTR